MSHCQSDRNDEINKMAMLKEHREAAEKNLEKMFETMTEVEGHDDARDRLQLAAKFLDVARKMEKKEDMSLEDMSITAKMIITMMQDAAKQDERKEAPLPDSLLVPAEKLLDLSAAELSWRSINARGLCRPTVIGIYNDAFGNGASERRDFAIKRLEELKIPYTVSGKNGQQLEISFPTRVCQEQYALAGDLAYIFDRALEISLGKSKDHSIIVYEAQDAVSVTALTKLGYCVEMTPARTIITL